MPYTKLSILFQVATTGQGAAIGHAGGWSESIWTQSTPNIWGPLLDRIMQKRSVLLPKQCSIIGFRAHVYNLDQIKLIPTGSSAGSANWPGNAAYNLNLPSDSLRVKFQGIGVGNFSPYTLRAVPDSVIDNGEYDPDRGFTLAVSAWIDQVEQGGVFGFLHRDFTNGAVQLNSYQGTVANFPLTANAAIPGVGNGDWIQFKRVKDDAKLPVTGVYKVSSAAGAPVYLLVNGPAQTVSKPNGQVRKFSIAFSSYANGAVDRAVSRKIGGGFQKYRGRRSKRRT